MRGRIGASSSCSNWLHRQSQRVRVAILIGLLIAAALVWLIVYQFVQCRRLVDLPKTRCHPSRDSIIAQERRQGSQPDEETGPTVHTTRPNVAPHQAMCPLRQTLYARSVLIRCHPYHHCGDAYRAARQRHDGRQHVQSAVQRSMGIAAYLPPSRYRWCGS